MRLAERSPAPAAMPTAITNIQFSFSSPSARQFPKYLQADSRAARAAYKPLCATRKQTVSGSAESLVPALESGADGAMLRERNSRSVFEVTS